MNHLNKTTFSVCLLSLSTYQAYADNKATSIQDHKHNIENVVITATRQSSSSLNIAGNISIVDESALEQTKPVHINEIGQRVPGTWISRGNGQEHLTAIRSPVLTGAGSCGAFVMAQDGVGLRGQGFCNANQLFESLYEFGSRIEVIRGPAGVFYGSGAMHGAINIITPTPKNTDKKTQVSADAGADDYYRLTVKQHINTEESGNWIIGVNGTSDGGYKRESGFDQQKLMLKQSVSQNNVDIDSLLSVTNLNQETATFIKGDKGIYKEGSRKTENDTPEAFRDAKSFKYHSRMDKTLDDGSHFVVTPYLRHSDMRFLMHWLPWQPVEQNRHTSIGVQTALHSTGSDALRTKNRPDSGYVWSSGFDVEYTKGSLTQIQERAFSPSKPQGAHYDFDVSALTAATFAQVTAFIGPKSEFILGGRFQHTAYDYTNNLSDGSACAPGVTNCRYTRPADTKESYGDWTHNISFQHHLSNNTTSWIKYTRGFRAPEATELFRLEEGQTIAGIQSETLSSSEFGVRHAGDQVQLEAVAFNMKKRNAIYKSGRDITSGLGTNHFGFELALNLALTNSLELGFNTTLARHEYDNNALGAGTKGNTVDTAPEQISAITLSWQPIKTVSTELEWLKMGEYFLDSANEHTYDGHEIYSLRASWDVMPDVALNLRVTNITDEDYAERADFSFGSYRYFVGEPRSAIVGVDVKF